MKSMWSLRALLFALAVASASHAQDSVVCPSPANLVKVKVEAKVTFDAGTQLYTYEYTVDNDASSLQEVAEFALSLTPPISEIKAPRGWNDSFFGADQNPTHDPSASDGLPPNMRRLTQISPPARYYLGCSKLSPAPRWGAFLLRAPDPRVQSISLYEGLSRIRCIRMKSRRRRRQNSAPEKSLATFSTLR